jgi:AcrR family transcriptional regulator
VEIEERLTASTSRDTHDEDRSEAVRRSGRPTLEQSAALKEEIVRQAFELACTLGSGGFSIDALAESTGITKRTIYRHFENKTALIEAVVEHEIAKSSCHAQSDAADVDPLEALRGAARGYFECQHRPATFSLANFLAFERQSNPVLAARQQEWIERTNSTFRELICNAQQAHLLPDVHADELVVLLLDLIAGSATRLRAGMAPENAFGGLSPEDFFAKRWAMFVALARPDPWER